MNAMTLRFAACSLLLASATLLAGCTVGPDFKRPEPLAVDRYTASPVADTVGTGANVQHLAAGAELPPQWWQLFHSARLDALVHQALAANPGLAAAQASLRQAQESLAAGRGAAYPTVTADANVARQRVAGSLASPAASGASYYTLHTAQLDVNWAPDLFGGTRRELEALRAQTDVQRYQLQAARLSLVGELVVAVINQAGLRAQIAATQAIVTDQQQTLDSVERQFALGQLARSDVVAQQALLAQAQATLPPLRKQLNQQNDAIAALLGVAPAQAQIPEFALADLPLPSRLPLRLPAEVIARRPDVQAAQAQWHAANAQIGVAVANRLPKLTLTADIGSSATGISQLFDRGTGFWSLAGDLAQPLFDAGNLRHQQRAAVAARDAAAAQYRGTVIAALQGVADALYALQGDADALAAAHTAERAAADSLAIARRGVALGNVNRVALLQAEQAWQQTCMALVQAQVTRRTDSVALLVATGGNEPEPAVPPVPVSPTRNATAMEIHR